MDDDILNKEIAKLVGKPERLAEMGMFSPAVNWDHAIPVIRRYTPDMFRLHTNGPRRLGGAEEEAYKAVLSAVRSWEPHMICRAVVMMHRAGLVKGA